MNPQARPEGGDICNGSYAWFEGVRQLPVFEIAGAALSPSVPR